MITKVSSQRLHIGFIFPTKLSPTLYYGGTERWISLLFRGLSEQGHKLTLFTNRRSQLPYPHAIIPIDGKNPQKVYKIVEESSCDILHFVETPKEPFIPKKPFLVTIHGNGKPGEVFNINTNFVSRNHAERHNASSFVYHGIDTDFFSPASHHTFNNNGLLFLAKARWNVKNLTGAIHIAKRSSFPLHIVGGSHVLSNRLWLKNIFFHGILNDQQKKTIMHEDCFCLLFPVLWDEPFGLALIESLACGLYVLATPYGSIPEIITPYVGKLCHTLADFMQGIEERNAFLAKDCIEYAKDTFSYPLMTKQYIALYDKVLSHKLLNPSVPRTLSVGFYPPFC